MSRNTHIKTAILQKRSNNILELNRERKIWRFTIRRRTHSTRLLGWVGRLRPRSYPKVWRAGCTQVCRSHPKQHRSPSSRLLCGLGIRTVWFKWPNKTLRPHTLRAFWLLTKASWRHELGLGPVLPQKNCWKLLKNVLQLRGKNT